MKSNKPVLIWLNIGAILVASMVVVGGITRLTDSGLSMVDWKLIMGSIPPGSEEEWQAVFEGYKQFPEYKEINSDFTLSEFKSIYWWEYGHRLLGRVIGIIFIVPFIFFWARGYFSKSLTYKLLVLFALGALQGFLGWFMVKSGLVDRPDVSHYRLAIHLVNALILLSYIVWLILSLTNTVKSTVRIQLYYKTMWFMYFVVMLQITYGAFVAGLKAGKFHNSFPLMDNQWIPNVFSTLWQEYGWLTLTDTVSGVQFVHRWLGMFIFIAIIALYVNYKPSLLPIAKRRLKLLVIVVSIQAIIGILTLIMAAPFTFALIHQFVGVILVIIMTINVYGAQPGFRQPA